MSFFSTENRKDASIYKLKVDGLTPGRVRTLMKTHDIHYKKASDSFVINESTESRKLSEAAQLRPIKEEDDSAFEVEEGPNGEKPMFASGNLGEMAVSYHSDDDIYDIVIFTADDNEFFKEYTTYSKAMSDAQKLVKILDTNKNVNQEKAQKELKASLKSLKFE